MSGEKEVVLESNQVRFSGDGTEKDPDRIFTMVPLYGLKSIKVVPRFLAMLSRALVVAMKAGIRLDKMLLEDESDVSFDTGMLLSAATIILEQLSQDWDEFSFVIFPVLINAKTRDGPWLSSHGTTIEFATAIWKAIKFHAPMVLGDGVLDSLKKSVVEEEETAKA